MLYTTTNAGFGAEIDDIPAEAIDARANSEARKAIRRFPNIVSVFCKEKVEAAKATVNQPTLAILFVFNANMTNT
jgi:hypothetical protein